MTDLYANYAALAAAHPIGVDYRLLSRTPTGSKLVHLAIHGGEIEPGTTELADYLSGSAHRYYSFDCMLTTSPSDLHLSSDNYDEPQALALVTSTDYVISWHGTTGSDPVTYLSGLDTATIARLQTALTAAGFTVATSPPDETDGNDTANLANKGSRTMGVQIQLSLGLRQSFFTDFSRTGRDSGPRTVNWFSYTTAVRTALTGLDSLGKPQNAIAGGQSAQPVSASAAGVGDFGIPTLSPLTVDGMPLTEVTSALRLAQTRAISSPAEPFWSSVARLTGDPTREVFEFGLGGSRPVNQVCFALAHFPQRAWLQYRDSSGQWQPMTAPGSTSPIAVTIGESVPPVVPAGVTGDLRLHPQHFGSGHWVPQDIQTTSVTASRFRLILTRIPSSNGPRGIDGMPVAFSLGVKNAAVSYRAASRADLPWLPQADTEHTVPLAGSQDVLGSQVEFAVRSNDAANLLRANGGVWRCEPMPTPLAVVSLFLDMRTATGDAQVVDRLYLEPLTAGPAMNIYYSQESAEADRFAPARTALGFPTVRPSAIPPQTSAEGIGFADPSAFLDVDNAALQWNPQCAFLLAMMIKPQYTSDDTATYSVLDNGLLTITITAGVLSVAFGDRVVEMGQVDLAYNQLMPLAVAFDGQRLTVRTPWETRVQDHAVPPPGPVPAALRLGASLTGTPGSYRLTSLLLARGRAEDIESIDAYWEDPAGYAMPPGYGIDTSQHTSANSLLRMDPSLMTSGSDSVTPYGMIGGPGLRYPDVSWTPIPGSFILRKGFVKFRPILARHIKLEFTNLQPVPVTPSAAAPITKVQLFPMGTTSGSSPVAAPATTLSGVTSASTKVALQGGPYQYQDAQRIVPTAALHTRAVSPTEALYAPDPQDAQNLRRTGNFPYMPMPGTHAYRFPSTGVHRYHTVDVAMNAKTAYTVALREVLAYAQDPTSERDTEQYIELFHTTEHISGYVEGDPAGWNHSGNGAMVTGDLVPWTGARLTSDTYVSRRRVTALQMATQQSNPKQLVADPDFDDPFLREWRPVGDARIAPSDRFSTTIGQMAQVQRGHSQSTWDALERQFATWDAIEASVDGPLLPTWADIEASAAETFDSGGIESLHPVTPPPAGRLYAAARVLTTGALAQPLVLQLVTGDGRIIAEISQTVASAQVAEFFVGVTMHGASPQAFVTWSQAADNGSGGTRTWTQMEALGTWGDVTQDFGVDDVSDVRVRLVQEGVNGTDVWFVDSLTIYADPMVWEVSRDGGRNWFEVVGIRNDPRGVFVFPALPPGDLTNGTQLRWRATGYSPDLSLSAVVIRPWYASLNGAVPYHDSLSASGASGSLADFYPDITQDPFWQAWSKPIPQDWWLAARQWQLQTNPPTPPLPAITISDALVEGMNEGTGATAQQVVPSDAIVLNP